MRRATTLVLSICLCLLVIAACSSSDDEQDSPTDPPPTTEQATQATEEATPEETVAVTEEAEIISVSEGGEYYIAVSYTVDPAENEDVGEAPEGQQWLIVVATLSNQAGETVTVNPEDLALLDNNDNRYPPEQPDNSTQPPMVGAELAEGESVLGLARFAIPENVIPTVLEWCPGGTCETPLQSRIP